MSKYILQVVLIISFLTGFTLFSELTLADKTQKPKWEKLFTEKTLRDGKVLPQTSLQITDGKLKTEN